MVTKNYRLYWREFNGYLGSKMGYRNSLGKMVYEKKDLFKFGHEEVGKDRVEQNAKWEVENKWKDLFAQITLRDYVDFYCTKEQIKEIEKAAFSCFKKDFWMEEQISGITEFVLSDRKKEITAENIFKELKAASAIYNKENRPQSDFNFC